ncbi:MAG: 16S rRNA (guanine(966)-N(2))-methyltransferase RsmD [Oscillospiraceae bacterium]|nr:16S rRNA (guanine(966)-N(2))-methyltransferase RsmD [Oscillospiraceae bacterium]
MRVITGTARGRKLQTLPGLDVRPTTDQVKEAIFSTIQFEVEGSLFLDLFAGSGQMGIEALSRGARFCVFVDSSRQAQDVIRDNLASTGLAKQSRVAAMDSLGYLTTAAEQFDIAFLDPPYNQGLIPKALPLLAPKMTPGGVILCEHQKGEELPETAGEFKIYRTYRYGKVMVTAYRRPADQDDE